MPPRTATRAKATVPDAGPSRPTRSTRATATTKKVEVEVEPESEEEKLAKQMRRVLKVSEPEPQAKARITKTPATSRKAEQAEKVEKVSSSGARATAAASAKTATTSRTPARTVAKVLRPETSDDGSKPVVKPTEKAAAAPIRISRRPVEPSTTIKAPVTQSSGSTATKSISSSSASAVSKPSRAETSTRPATSSRPAVASSSRLAPVVHKTAPSTASLVSRPKATQEPGARTSTITKSPPPPTRPTVSLKGKETEQSMPELSAIEYPWMYISADVSANIRAQNAMAAIKTCLAIFGLAVKAGYQYGSEKPGMEEWTVERIDKEMAICDTALRVLREMDRECLLGSKGVEVEKAGQAVIAKSMTMGMWRRAFDQLARSKENILRHYCPKSAQRPTIPEPVSLIGTRRIPEEWLSALWLPESEEGGIPENMRGVCLQQLIGAWACLISIEGYGFDLPPFADLMPSASSPRSDFIHPSRLGASAPIPSCAPALTFFSRRHPHIPMTAPHWPHIFGIAMQSLLAVSTSVAPPQETSPPQPPPRTPSSVWETAHKWIAAYLKRTDIVDDQSKAACRLITDIVSWADEVVAIRGEARGSWYKGQAWSDLAGLWVDLARKTRDTQAMDLALSASTASMSLGSTLAPRPMTSSVGDVKANSGMPVYPSDQALDHLTSMFAQLGAIEAAASQTSDPTSKSQMLECVRRTTWNHFAPSIAGLADDKAGREAFARAYRSAERARRVVVIAPKGDRGSDLFKACRQWLSEASEAIGQAIKHLSLEDVPDHDGLLLCCITSVCVLQSFQSNDVDENLIIGPLERARTVACLARNADTRADCLRSLAESAYSSAYGLYGHKRYDVGSKVIQLSIDMTQLALSTLEDKSRLETSASWQNCVVKIFNKYDVLSACLLSSDRREDAIRVTTESLKVHEPSTYTKLDALPPTATLADTFGELSRLDGSINRLALSLTNDLQDLGPGVAINRVESICEILSRDISRNAYTVIMERLSDAITLRASKSDGLEISFLLCEKLVGLFGEQEEHALRKVRILSRMLLLTAAHGLRPESFNALVDQIEACLTVLRSEDAADMALAAEYQAILHVLKAFNAYQVHENASQDVLSSAELAIRELQHLLVPPTRPRELISTSTASRDTNTLSNGSSTTQVAGRKAGTSIVTPTKKVARSVSAGAKVTKSSTSTGNVKKRRSSGMPIAAFDDISRLTILLTSLASLLGLLGHALAKVNALKVLRALLRHRGEYLNDYISHSAELATLYSKLGKYSRAEAVFKQALQSADGDNAHVTPGVKSELYLRHCEHLASLGQVEQAVEKYHEGERFHLLVEDVAGNALPRDRRMHYCARLERLSLAHRALAAIRMAEDNAAGAIKHMKSVVGLRSRIVASVAQLALDRPKAPEEGDDEKSKESTSQQLAESTGEKKGAGAADPSSPFVVAPLPPDKTGANEPSKDDQAAAKTRSSTPPMANKYLHGVQWTSADHVLEAYIDLSNAYAQRGSVADAQLYLEYAKVTAQAVKSSAILARTATRSANLNNRLRKLELAEEKIGEASNNLAHIVGPDAFDLQIVRGDLLARQNLAEEAAEILDVASTGIHGLDTQFVAADALLPTPKKDALKKLSLSSSIVRAHKEPLLPSSLSQVLRQQAWLSREAGQIKESDELYRQVKLLQSAGETKAEEFYLHGKIALDNAFKVFKTDLFMSSLTESTIAMPMGTAGKKLDHRQSARHRIQVILDQADEAYRAALSMVAGSGRVEDVRQACLSLALLRAFQTSLGQGGMDVTAFAADILATSTAVTLHRELLEAIEGKFYDYKLNDTAWPQLDPSSREAIQTSDSDDDDVLDELPLKSYWQNVKSRYLTNDHLSPSKSAYDLSPLPHNWAVLSISVTEDHNTMFISRHQNGHDPLVFVLPLDRQNKRDPRADLFTFDDGIQELKDIVGCSDESSRSAKTRTTSEEKTEWWAARYALDERMKVLVNNVEYCWLGAFKTIFSPRLAMPPARLALFRSKIEKVFNLALFGSAHDTRKSSKVHLNDSLLECFATLSPKSEAEEIEDLTYFILDIYQFHGVPVAIEELDLDQIGVDLVTALTEMEASAPPIEIGPEGPEHIFLALDKNTQAFPWESIPCLRGRPISRVPSLPVLLDQVALTQIQQPATGSGSGPKRRTVNSKKTYFILNPSGDLTVTQATFEPMLKEMQEHSGWKGMIGDKPSELELSRILRDYDLVLYFGHGGAEQYIRGAKVRVLPKCATTFLWGCSSGKLEDQGDLDATGTAWSYIMAGCPALTATLWDVTDRDIDKVTSSVFNRLGLNHTQLMPQEKPRAEHSHPGLLPPSGGGLGVSTVQAVNEARGDCKMKYLTGAAVVHYGIPVYIY